MKECPKIPLKREKKERPLIPGANLEKRKEEKICLKLMKQN